MLQQFHDITHCILPHKAVNTEHPLLRVLHNHLRRGTEQDANTEKSSVPNADFNSLGFGRAAVLYIQAHGAFRQTIFSFKATIYKRDTYTDTLDGTTVLDFMKTSRRTGFPPSNIVLDILYKTR